MMTFHEFFNQYNNTSLEWVDPSNKYQCVDLVVCYIERGLGFPRLTNGIGVASQLWTAPTQGLRENFDFIANTETNVPQAGDILVFKGVVGHTSLATGIGNVDWCESLDQNWDTEHYFHLDSEGRPIPYCRLVRHDYQLIYGWLRPKVKPMDTSTGYPDLSLYPQFKLIYEKLVTKSTNYDAITTYLALSSDSVVPSATVLDVIKQLQRNETLALKEADNRIKQAEDLKVQMADMEARHKKEIDFMKVVAPDFDKVKAEWEAQYNRVVAENNELKKAQGIKDLQQIVVDANASQATQISEVKKTSGFLETIVKLLSFHVEDIFKLPNKW